MAEQGQSYVRVYAGGVYDCFHVGHANLLRQCKEQAFPGEKVWLIAGIGDQRDVERHKGPTIYPQRQRIEMAMQNRHVDEIIPKAPWVITEEFLKQYNIDWVCHDEVVYKTAGVEDAYGVCKRLGKFKATQRTEGVSTTDIVSKVLKKRREFERALIRRGKKRQDIDLSLNWLWHYWTKFRLYLCPRRFQAKRVKR